MSGFTLEDLAIFPHSNKRQSQNARCSCISTYLHSAMPLIYRWEKPGSVAIDLIFVNPPQCVLDAGHAGNATTMHVFLGGSTSYCLTD